MAFPKLAHQLEFYQMDISADNMVKFRIEEDIFMYPTIYFYTASGERFLYEGEKRASIIAQFITKNSGII